MATVFGFGEPPAAPPIGAGQPVALWWAGAWPSARLRDCRLCSDGTAPAQVQLEDRQNPTGLWVAFTDLGPPTPEPVPGSSRQGLDQSDSMEPGAGEDLGPQGVTHRQALTVAGKHRAPTADPRMDQIDRSTARLPLTRIAVPPPPVPRGDRRASTAGRAAPTRPAGARDGQGPR